MGRQIRKSKGKTMKPNFFVFCEGESEVAYISHLRSQYRVPIQIIPRKRNRTARKSSEMTRHNMLNVLTLLFYQSTLKIQW